MSKRCPKEAKRRSRLRARIRYHQKKLKEETTQCGKDYRRMRIKYLTDDLWDDEEFGLFGS